MRAEWVPPWRIALRSPWRTLTMPASHRISTCDISAWRLAGYRLHPLKGALKGYWSISISGNWRRIFRFENGDACDVDLIDYH